MVATELVKADPVALKVWKITDKYFKESGIQDKVDLIMLEMYCLTVSEYREYVDIVKQTNAVKATKGGDKIRSQVIMRNNAAKLMIQLAQNLGIDRKTRSKGYSLEKDPTRPHDRAATLMKKVA